MDAIKQISTLFILLAGFMFLGGCSTNTEPEMKTGFSYEGLRERAVMKLKKQGNTLYAGTYNNGLYKKTDAKRWKSLGPKSADARAFVILSENTYLASAVFVERDSLTIAKTTDGGKDWMPYRSNYGGEYRRAPTVMMQLPSSPGIIYAGGPGVRNFATSTDGGKTWDVAQLVDGELYEGWGSGGGLFFITIEPDNPDNIWIGGEGGFFEPRLYHTTDGGKTWERITWGGEARIRDLLLHYKNSKHILISIGFTVLKSTDGMETYESNILKQFAISTLAHSTRDPKIVYAAGFNEILFFAASSDFGETWEIVEMKNGPKEVHVYDMISVMENGREVLYFGTNKGVYSFRFDE